MELLEMNCPDCSSTHFRVHTTYQIQNYGLRRLYECQDCCAYLSETKNTPVEDLKTPLSVVWKVLQAWTEGMGVNATAQTFGISPNTVRDREQRGADL